MTFALECCFSKAQTVTFSNLHLWDVGSKHTDHKSRVVVLLRDVTGPQKAFLFFFYTLEPVSEIQKVSWGWGMDTCAALQEKGRNL